MKGTACDPLITQQFADSLYAQAQKIIAEYTEAGALAGAIGGYMSGGTSCALFGAFIVGILGLAAGRGRSSALQLRAQLALCQVRIEQNMWNV